MKTQIQELEEELSDLNQKMDSDKDCFLKFAFRFISSLGENFLTITPENCTKCKQIIFPAGFYMDAEKNVYTPEINPLIRLAGNKKDAEASDFTHLVQHYC